MVTRFLASLFLLLALSATAARAQLAKDPASDTIRVTVSQNDDGSQTAYQVDPANRRATATTTGSNGKLIGRIRYTLDDAGRYATGEVFGPNDKFQFRTLYKYDATGRLVEETRLTRENVVQMKLIYSYDGNGRQAGYSVYDAAGKLLGETSKKR